MQPAHWAKQYLPGLALTALGLAALLPELLRPLWFDEALTVLEYLVLPSYSDIYQTYTNPNNHIGYVCLLKLWTSLLQNLLPDVPLIFRLLSFSLAGATVILLWSLCRRRFGAVPAILTTAALITSYPWLIYGVAVRGYMLSMLCITICLHAFMLAAKGRVRTGAILFLLASFAAIADMPSNLPPCLAISAGFALLAIRENKSKEKASRHWLFFGAIAPLLDMLFYLPLLNGLRVIYVMEYGWHNRWQALFSAYATPIALYLPLSAAAAFAAGILIKRRMRTPAGNKGMRHWLPSPLGAIALLAAIIPAICLCLRTPAPALRFFLGFLPILLLAMAWMLWTLQAYLRLNLGKRRSRSYMLALFAACLSYMALSHAVPAAQISSVLVHEAAMDDIIQPAYMRNFHPESVAAKIHELYDNDPQIKVYVAFDADPLALTFAGRMEGLPDNIWLYECGNRNLDKLPLALTQNSGLYLVFPNENAIPQFKKTYGIQNDIVIVKDFGKQKLYFLKTTG